MKIAVCEDNKNEMQAICNYINNYCESNGFLVDIQTYNNAESLLAAYPNEKHDVIFLDIYMDGLTGIDAAKKIREYNIPCTIVFITSSENHSLDAYAVDGAAYILKPVSQSKITHALSKCRDKLLESSRYITVTTKELGKIDIPLANILYAEVYDKMVYIHVENSRIATNKMTLGELEEKMGGEPFLRCHRSYIINMNHVDTLTKGEFVMKNGDKVLFADRSYGEIQLIFGNFITKKLREEL